MYPFSNRSLQASLVNQIINSIRSDNNVPTFKFIVDKYTNVPLHNINIYRFAAMCQQIRLYGTDSLNYEPNYEYMRSIWKNT